MKVVGEMLVNPSSSLLSVQKAGVGQNHISTYEDDIISPQNLHLKPRLNTKATGIMVTKSALIHKSKQ